jgi:hypothetical protein
MLQSGSNKEEKKMSVNDHLQYDTEAKCEVATLSRTQTATAQDNGNRTWPRRILHGRGVTIFFFFQVAEI